MTQQQRYDFKKIAEFSPYLWRLLEQYQGIADAILTQSAQHCFDALSQNFSHQSEAKLMRDIRRYKQQAALIIALADISGEWDLNDVTSALSKVARTTIKHSLAFLLTRYQRTLGLEIKDSENGCGLFVLAMGKLGAEELNYSSDVDLIILYDVNKLSMKGGRPLPRLLNRLAQDFVKLMQERTADGYVFRTDLRLRPDPASTPLIMTTEAAMRYYESVGQNWERAAFIKAKPIAGDIALGERFLSLLSPFIWRKSLDFAAIADIQSIKRQMDRAFDNSSFSAAGYDVKKGLGGIREIEFLAQIHQLIWGGKQPELRTHKTIETYDVLASLDLMDAQEVNTLCAHYETLRHYEHRLQMTHDEQTHTLPLDDEKREKLALFCGETSLSAFDKRIHKIASETHKIYTECFADSQSLAGDGKLSFTGVSHDKDTLKTLTEMGFKDPEQISSTIQSWHRGSVAAMRSSRSRELLTELTPTLLKHLGSQADADSAFRRFSRFFSKLPGGVTLLSLLHNNPDLLEILSLIIGNAPQLAEYLGKHPDWMDALLTLNHQEPMTIENLKTVSHYETISNRPEEIASWLCRYRCEHEFILGCQLLAGIQRPSNILSILSHIADEAIHTLSEAIIERYREEYGVIADSEFTILALGKLGSEELTFGSDLDLLFVYDVEDEAADSDGARSLAPGAYYNRLAQRIVGQLSAMTPEGRLYEVDDRLRPTGKDGPLAVNYKTMQRYFEQDAWTFERMALLKQRVIYTTAPKKNSSQKFKQLLKATQNSETLHEDALDMRRRLWKEFGSMRPWNIKHCLGGLIDITFITQILSLEKTNEHTEWIGLPTYELIEKIEASKQLSPNDAEVLRTSYQFQKIIQAHLRLCYQKSSEELFSTGLRQILAASVDCDSFKALEEQLHNHQQASYTLFKQIFGDYL